MPLTILTEAELRRCVTLDLEVVDAIADAFSALASGRVVMPPILHMALAEANGEVDVKTAYVPGLPSFAIKVSPGFFDNPKQGLPSLSGMMMLLSASTGRLEALHLDNGYLTELRTAAAGAVAARHLARSDARIAGVLGAGRQAQPADRGAASSCGRSSASCSGRAIRPRPRPPPTRWPSGWPRRAAGRERRAAGARGRRGGHRDALAHAARGRGLAAPGAAHHRDGLRCRRQERAPPRRAEARRSPGLRQPGPVRAPRRAAPCARRQGSSSTRPSSARSPPAAGPAGRATIRSRSAI